MRRGKENLATTSRIDISVLDVWLVVGTKDLPSLNNDSLGTTFVRRVDNAVTIANSCAYQALCKEVSDAIKDGDQNKILEANSKKALFIAEQFGYMTDSVKSEEIAFQAVQAKSLSILKEGR